MNMQLQEYLALVSGNINWQNYACDVHIHALYHSHIFLLKFGFGPVT